VDQPIKQLANERRELEPEARRRHEAILDRLLALLPDEGTSSLTIQHRMAAPLGHCAFVEAEMLVLG